MTTTDIFDARTHARKLECIFDSVINKTAIKIIINLNEQEYMQQE